MSPVWLMSVLDIHSDMAHAAKSKSKDIQLQLGFQAVDEDSLPQWAQTLLDYGWLEEE